MKYFLIAGEASGDLHGASLVKQIQAHDPSAQLAALGGDRMEAAGCFLYRHYRHMAFMGIVAVLRHWREVRDNFRIAREALLKEQPDVLILIDYPSFNLRIAAFCRKHLPQTRIYYYIPPKVWAWKSHRIHRIARLCDEVLGIFPFEPAYYALRGYRCTYVGHPTAEEMKKVRDSQITNHKSPITNHQSLAILPGSRVGEIQHCLPLMLEVARRFSDYTIEVCAAPGIEDTFYAPYLRTGERLTRDTYQALCQAQAAIVTSGTATLEAALLRCPQVAVFHMRCATLLGWLRPRFQSVIFSIPYFTPVNLIAGKQVIRECIAEEFTEEKVEAELRRIITDEAYQKEMLANYEHLYNLLGSSSASEEAARIITKRSTTPPVYTA